MKYDDECKSLDDLIGKLREYHPDVSEAEINLVQNAYRFAEKAHEGQTRKSGEAYFVHPLTVAGILAGLTMDPETIAAGLLHDTVEDCDEVNLDVIRSQFGQGVANLVDGVTKLERYRFATREEQRSETLRKVFIATGDDIRVAFIKLADRVHNMRTLDAQSEASQKRIAQETLDIYAPFAERLGIYKIKQELEDLSFRYLHQDHYRSLSAKVNKKLNERKEYVQSIIDELDKEIAKYHINHKIEGRAKGLYSIYHKMVEKEKTFEEIYDLTAIRVLVSTTPECYAVLGVVHNLWTAQVNRFKDYISCPKSNGYQSLHTTVIGNDGMPFEVQIRTFDMHHTAEYGFSAHWQYKDGGSVTNGTEVKLSWLREFLELERDTKDSTEYFNALKTDLRTDEITVNTPNGDVKILPVGATPVDFAYCVHTNVGNKCVGAKVNGRMVTLDTTLQAGDIVQIITQENSKGPSRDWLNFVKTTRARAKIRSFYKLENKSEDITTGKQLLEAEARQQLVNLSSIIKPAYMEPILRKHMLVELEDIYAAIGRGSLKAANVIARLCEEKKKHEKTLVPVLPRGVIGKPHSSKSGRNNKEDLGVSIEGCSGFQVHFAKCCTPLPGDEIIGFITRGRGVTVHSADCVNVRVTDEPDRWIKAEWNEATNSKYKGNLQIVAENRKNVTADLMTYLTTQKVEIYSVNAHDDKDRQKCTIDITLAVANKKELDWIIDKIRSREGILGVLRT